MTSKVRFLPGSLRYGIAGQFSGLSPALHGITLGDTL